MSVRPVKNESVWKSLKIIFVGSLLLFLINILFGFDNSFTVGEIPRANLLIHLHAGSIGWITLTVIGFAIWALTGSRQVSAGYEKNIRYLAWAAVIIFAGYIPNFWLAFSRGEGPLLALLPIFGSASVLILWWASIYGLSQLGKQETMTTVHLLAVGALLVASIGATVGALLGMERVIGRFLPLPEADRVGAHAGMMETYLFLAAGAVIEMFTFGGEGKKWSIAGLIQAVSWSIGAALVPIAFFTGSVPQLLPIFVLLLLLGMVIFLVRVAWRAVLAGPMAPGGKSWSFFGALWLVVFLITFIIFAMSMDSPLPTWFDAVRVHSGFVGMMTNVLFAVIAAHVIGRSDALGWGEPAAMWIINLGLLVFFGLKIASGTNLGALVMGIGVLLGVITLILRLRAADSPAGAGVEAA